MKIKTNRAAIYYIKDDLYEYNIYFMEHLLSYVDDLYIVVSKNFSEEKSKLLKKFGKIIIFNASDTLSAYKYVLEDQKKNIEKYKQVVFCDSYIFGPFQLLDKFFDDITNCKADIYTLESRMDNLISCSFFVLKNVNYIDLLVSISSSQYWIKAENLTIISFIHFTEQDNFYFLEIPDNIIQKKQPFLQFGFFMQYPDNWLTLSGGMQIRKVFDFIKKDTFYNEKMILDYLVKKQPMSILRQNLHLNYILPSDFSYPHNSEASVALIIYIYYEDLVDYCYKYALSMPNNADIYIITCKDEMTQICKKAFTNFPCRKLYFKQMENRGRDVAAYLVAAKDVFYKYDYVCCMHDKKSPQYSKSVGEDFRNHLFECNLLSADYVKNIIKTFDENNFLGMLVPPNVNFGKINTVGNSIAKEENNIKQQLSNLNFSVPFDFDVVAPIGTMFWVRGKSFLPIFNYNWKHNDFPEEPNKSSGTLLHTLERTYSFAVQEAGFYTGFVLPQEYAQIYLDTTYWLYKERQQQFYSLNGKKIPKSEIKDQTAIVSKAAIHFKDIKRIVKEYFKQKFKRKKHFKKVKKICCGNIWCRYAGIDNGRVILHLLSRNDKIYLQSSIYKFYPKKELSLNECQLQDYYKNYNTKGIFIEIPLDKVKNHQISVKQSENEYFILKWNGDLTFSYGCFDIKKEGFFTRIHKGCLYIEDKFHFYKNVLFSGQYSIRKKILFLILKLNPIHKYILFAENGGAGDNCFELFKYAVQKNKNCYFIASKSVIDGVQDLNIKKHMVVSNSWKHVWMFFCSHKWITSYTLLLELFPQKRFLRDIMMYNIPGKWIFVPHGITCDKVSIMVHKYSWQEPDVTYCSSDFEKEYFTEKYGYRNVFVNGNPRMDKWYNAKLDNRKILLFFTWRFAMNTSKNKNILEKNYISNVNAVVNIIRKSFPQKHIYYVFHHEVVRSGVDEQIKRELGNKNITYIYFNSTEGIQEFNKQFKSAKYLITDYSSVAYDFAYKKGAIPIYYLDKEFISGHYPLEQKFFDIHLGVLTYTAKDLEQALKLNAPTEDMKRRKKMFFRYQDNKNCERVYNAIFSKK